MRLQTSALDWQCAVTQVIGDAECGDSPRLKDFGIKFVVDHMVWFRQDFAEQGEYIVRGCFGAFPSLNQFFE